MPFRRVMIVVALMLAAPFTPAGTASAAPAPDASSPGVSAAGTADERASPPDRTRVYLGMWTSHVTRPKSGLEGNALLGLASAGFYGATFINSYGDRAYAAGIQRGITPATAGRVTAALGYRAGLVTGYDERFLPVAGRLPAVPFVQLVAHVDVRRFGLELAYAGLVTSVLASFRL